MVMLKSLFSQLLQYGSLVGGHGVAPRPTIKGQSSANVATPTNVAQSTTLFEPPAISGGELASLHRFMA